MGTIQCFLLEPADKVQHSLRRFVFSVADRPKCRGAFGYHNAEVFLAIITPTNPNDLVGGDFWPHHDPKWPTKCDGCGYLFQDSDPWMRHAERLWVDPRTGQLVTLRQAPVGAMWWATWYADPDFGSQKHQARGGGPHLIVKTPAGDWDIDAPSDNGQGWDRTGVPPVVTARPSIGMRNEGGGWRYHAFLTDGRLEDC